MESLQFGPPPRSRLSQGLIAGGVVAVVAVVVAGITLQRPDGRDPSDPSLSIRPTPTASRTSPPAGRPTPADQPRTRRIDPFLADLDLDLFVRGGRHLHRIQTQRRLMTTTPTPNLQIGGPLTMVLSPEQVLIRDWNNPGAGYVVPDGRPAQDLPDGLSAADQILAGPPNRLWVSTFGGPEPLTRLTDLAGRAVNAASGPSTYRGFSGLTEDRQGGLLMTGIGGTYALTGRGPRRITRGAVLAIGPRHFLVSDCTATLQCSRYLVRRDTGEQRRVGPATATQYAEGSLSADGAYAATWSWSARGTTTLVITDLRDDRAIEQLSDELGYAHAVSLVWLPDNRLLGVREGRLFLFDPATGRTTTPDLGIVESVEQIGVRTS